MSSVAAVVKAVPRIVTLALTGCLAGGLVGLAGCNWDWGWHEEDAFEFCDEQYEDCLARAITLRDRQWCENDVTLCYEGCEGRWEAEDDAAADENEAEGEAEQGNDDFPEDEGETGETGETEGETGEDPDVCIDLFNNCLESAETLQDVEACEVLYDHCVNPGECPLPECGGCPAEELEACLESYESCASLADTPEKIEACGASFDNCTAPFAAQCMGEENPNLEACLEQHELCVACAETDEQLAACQGVFDSCMAQ
jgi:hypothetical protein